MGVIGLTTFIDKNTHLLHKHELKDCSVVIDGNNLYHHVYRACRVEAKFGGDYDVYRRQLQINFKSLLKCGVTPYVVLDGGYTTDNKKLKKCIERAKDRVRNARSAKVRGECRILPLLAYDTFIQTLNELGIPHVTCQYEADCEIAKLANKLKCPVISNDSDFYIFDLTHGFLPLDYLDFNPLFKRNEDGSKASPFLYCQIYNIEGFLGSFEGMNRSMLPVFATLLGNDYAPPIAFQKIDEVIHLPKKKRVHLSPRVSRVMKLIRWLTTQFSDSENFIDSIRPYIRAQKKFFSSVEGYFDIVSFEGTDLFQYFSKGEEKFSPTAAASFTGYNGTAFPEWFLLSICKGQITPAIINAAVLHRIIFLTQVEDLSSPTSYLCSEPVRKMIYGIILKSDPAHRKENIDAPLISPDDGSNILSSALQSVIEKMDSEGGSNRKPNDVTLKRDDSRNEENEGDALCDMESEKCCADEQIDNRDGSEDCVENFEKLEFNSDEETDNDIEVISDCDEEIPALPQVRKRTQFEEYHRENKHLRKTYLEPDLAGGESLPTISEIGDLDQEARLSLLLGLLKVDHSFINMFSDNLCLYMVSIVLWLRHADPHFTENHLDCAILCPILLHMLRSPLSSLNEKNPRKKKTSSSVNSQCKKNMNEGAVEVNTYSCIDLDSVCEQAKVVNKKKFYTVRDNLDRYRTYKPEFNRRKGLLLECETVHAFAQLQSCIYEISNLNKLLRFPLPNIQPAFFINGSFLYNFYTDLVSRPVPTNFLEAMLLKGSELHNTFLSIRSVLLDTTVGASCFLAPIADRIKKRRKKNKGKKKKLRSSSSTEEKEDSVTGMSGENEEEITTLEGFDVRNKFSLLLS